MRGDIPRRANCDALQQIRHKRRMDTPRHQRGVVRKRTPGGRLINGGTYHVTKGWR
jgi:hypothetical protein